MRWTAMVGISLLAGGCAFEPEGALPMAPPSSYLAWWHETEACAGIEGDFPAVQWFEVPGESFECPSGRCVGRWEPPDRIYVASAWAGHEMVVRHEMLHQLLAEDGHPPDLFERRCGLTWTTWRGGGAAPGVTLE
ncbi:MAG: hypothetical protein SFU84_07360 [Gemmatimonadales bacterium]|nr:hypothetical protein [Gemmatimonadales bacterium]